MTSLEKAERIARILDEKKGKDIKILHVTDQTVITDYFVICGGGSNTQVKALSDEVEYKLKEEDGITPARVEGYDGGAWILIDYSDVIVHVFDPASREFYKLEKLWAQAEEIPFTPKED
ncbi:MAG: ribosome silencing factor [Clostridia bacterium]|nr:ribosome silencing factor [Clostridia bacterium]